MKAVDRPGVEELIKAITKKLDDHKDILARSVEGGSLDWDWTKNGAIRIKLKPRI